MSPGSKQDQITPDSSAEKEIAVIGDEDTVIGFGLVGVKYSVIIDESADNGMILASIKKLIETPKIGFVFITQRIAAQIRTEFEKLKKEKPLYPIFIELPDKHGELHEHVDPIKLLIKQAIGMELDKGKT